MARVNAALPFVQNRQALAVDLLNAVRARGLGRGERRLRLRGDGRWRSKIRRRWARRTCFEDLGESRQFLCGGLDPFLVDDDVLDNPARKTPRELRNRTKRMLIGGGRD